MHIRTQEKKKQPFSTHVMGMGEAPLKRCFRGKAFLPPLNPVLRRAETIRLTAVTLAGTGSVQENRRATLLCLAKQHECRVPVEDVRVYGDLLRKVTKICFEGKKNIDN